ncbi:FapA family protein [Clostridium sp. SHJSY1]|uniref:flagellar assembly protein A n=1 Tax=Clostridium sp. SHJSY1 TaxID=2942483 RepID=UPI0028770B0D|nr:flagellar assembly protein A [Clostridium sp. SHJSY1]MDS0524137.1 FapA family protein [Clostridium sp. SHJSY1]
MEYKFCGKSLEECIKKAEEELLVSRELFEVQVLEEKGFLKKKCCIKVIYEENKKETAHTEDISIESNIVDNNKTKIQNNDIVIQGEEIKLNIVENSVVKLEFEYGIKLFVNEQEINSPIEVTLGDTIRFETGKIEAKRDLKINTNPDNTLATVDIKYIPEEKKEVRFKIIEDKVHLFQEIVDGEMPPLYKKDELREALIGKGIVYGIIDEQLDKISKETSVKDEIVAKGRPVIHDELDKIDIKFENVKRNVEENSKENIDYRNLYSMPNVKKDQIIAELIEGSEGQDGINIFGAEIKKKVKKPLTILAGDGCILEENNIIATIDGRPSVKGGVFQVNKIFETTSDVDMASGNITFVGDVKISGSVKEGMKVEAGESVEVGQNVEIAKIITSGDVHIKGSVIKSEIIAGFEDVNLKNSINMLGNFKMDIEILVNSFEELKRRNLINDSKSIGEVIKILLETKLKDTQRKAVEILKNTTIEGEKVDAIKKILKEKIIGSGPLGIKYLSELYELIECIDKVLQPLKIKISNPVDVYFNYCQDSKIKASGTIYVTGKGQYVSALYADSNIEFLEKGAIARGGVLCAGKEIKAKVVGSTAGVMTILKVERHGVITADVAYPNTVFAFGERRYTLEIASKEIKAYLDEEGEVVVDKFVL